MLAEPRPDRGVAGPVPERPDRTVDHCGAASAASAATVAGAFTYNQSPPIAGSDSRGTVGISIIGKVA